MLIGLKKKFVFVANTKTASTSIESALRPHAEVVHGGTPARKHISLEKGLLAYPGHFPDGTGQGFFKFGVMRDPVEWIGSWFRFRKGNRVEAPLPAEMTFAQFWARGDWNIRRADGQPYLQSDLFRAADGRILADAIVPYDRLGEVFGQIADGLGIRSDLPRENVSRLTRLPDIPETLLAEMRAHYAPDYALLAEVDRINAQGIAALAAA